MNYTLCSLASALLLLSSNANAFMHNSYIKLGTQYYFSHSHDFELQRINPVPDTIEPIIPKRGIEGSAGTFVLAIGMTHALNSSFQISPELNYQELGSYGNRINDFIQGGGQFENALVPDVTGSVLSAVINFEYLYNDYLSFYIAPGIGMASLKTRNITVSYSLDDGSPEIIQSNEDRHNLAPQLAIGFKYRLTDHVKMDMGLSYLRLGKVPMGNFTTDDDDYTSTKLTANNAYLIGPHIAFLIS